LPNTEHSRSRTLGNCKINSDERAMGAATRKRLARKRAAVHQPMPPELSEAAPVALLSQPASIRSLLPEQIAAGLDILSPDQVAAALGINPITLRRWRKEGRGPPCSHHGRNTWYLGASLKAWLIEQEQAPPYRYKRRNGADELARRDEAPSPADRQRRRPARAASRSRTLAQRPRPPP
jgi:hypothetical protein